MSKIMNCRRCGYNRPLNEINVSGLCAPCQCREDDEKRQTATKDDKNRSVTSTHAPVSDDFLLTSLLAGWFS